MSEIAGMALNRLINDHDFPIAVKRDILSRLQSNQLGNNDEHAKEAYVWQQVRYLENWLKLKGE
ncbi:DUF6877 family protein [Liquorilactobacillus hordei]|uniref:DUF6877 domain-containing protein n=1 Tax=Liquorilactobacillus hordei DSM 19519 TaxID=1423759 RepID=A0A0R1MUC1_9LACO|nr:DUF6877 family protein [Liquorilactobacillus hordei]KRL08003.1 hypothetical protein FC92_GL001075 [Liquorilactobacillus hordei DSM 19519]QYH50982.1 hypothetical protein G6O70_00360 [Liquorilactobacillus hordei DSM 19519]